MNKKFYWKILQIYLFSFDLNRQYSIKFHSFDQRITTDHNSIYLFGLADARILIYSGLFNKGKGKEQPNIDKFSYFAYADAHTDSIQHIDINLLNPNFFCSSDFGGNVAIFDS